DCDRGAPVCRGWGAFKPSIVLEPGRRSRQARKCAVGISRERTHAQCSVLILREGEKYSVLKVRHLRVLFQLGIESWWQPLEQCCKDRPSFQMLAGQWSEWRARHAGIVTECLIVQVNATRFTCAGN